MKFKVGDKVRVRDDLIGGEQYSGLTFSTLMEAFRGKTFTIGYVDSYFEVYLFENIIGWYFSDEMLEPAVEPKAEQSPEPHKEKLVIYRDGNKTIAKYYKGDKVVTASATCCSCDNYDFKQGVALTTESVFNKMRDKEIEYTYVKCLGYRQKECFNFTVDKIYKISNDGKIACDDGYVFGECNFTKQETLDYLSEWYIFEEVDKSENPS